MIPIFIGRDGFEIQNGMIKKLKYWSPATLIIATTYGITTITEGGELLADSLYGYKIKHILYEKITAIELNICLLCGQLIFYTMSNSDHQYAIEFNTTSYYKDFERFIENVRERIFAHSNMSQ